MVGTQVIGLAVLFKLDESTLQGPKNERRIKGRDNEPLERTDDKIEKLSEEAVRAPEALPEQERSSDDGDGDDDQNDEAPESDDEEPGAFPDTEIKMDYSGKNIKVDAARVDDDVEEYYMGGDKPVLVKFKKPEKKPEMRARDARNRPGDWERGVKKW